MLDRKRLAFGAVFGAILVAMTLAGIEFMASFYTPSWPARAMNPREPAPEPRRHVDGVAEIGDLAA
jgi:hypothetical protein